MIFFLFISTYVKGWNYNKTNYVNVGFKVKSISMTTGNRYLLSGNNSVCLLDNLDIVNELSFPVSGIFRKIRGADFLSENRIVLLFGRILSLYDQELNPVNYIHHLGGERSLKFHVRKKLGFKPSFMKMIDDDFLAVLGGTYQNPKFKFFDSSLKVRKETKTVKDSIAKHGFLKRGGYILDIDVCFDKNMKLYLDYMACINPVLKSRNFQHGYGLRVLDYPREKLWYDHRSYKSSCLYAGNQLVTLTPDLSVCLEYRFENETYTNAPYKFNPSANHLLSAIVEYHSCFLFMSDGVIIGYKIISENLVETGRIQLENEIDFVVQDGLNGNTFIFQEKINPGKLKKITLSDI